VSHWLSQKWANGQPRNPEEEMSQAGVQMNPRRIWWLEGLKIELIDGGAQYGVGVEC